MNLSEDTMAVLEYLDSSIEGGLRKRDDVGVLLEICSQKDDAELFNSIAHTGTGLWRVYSTLRRVQAGAEGYSQLEKEFGNMLNMLRELLSEVVQEADDTTLSRFDEIYFGMTQGVIRNLVDLSSDLNKIKGMQHR